MKNIKILAINWSVEDGSIAKLMQDIETVNSDECEFYYCYQVGAKGTKSKYRMVGWNITRFYYMLARITGIKYGGGTIPTFFMFLWLNKIKPDIIHIHCPNFYNLNLYMLFRYLKKKDYRVIITNHAEFFYTGNCSHAEDCKGYFTGCLKCERIFDTKHPYLRNRTDTEWRKMHKAFENFDQLQMTAVSDWVRKRCEEAPITKKIPVRVIENAVDETIFYKKKGFQKKWRKEKIPEQKYILNVTSGFSDKKHDLKGGRYLIQTARELPEYIFWVAGNNNVEHPEKIPSNIRLLGNISDKHELADLYNCADLTVLTSKRETYGMACAESLACGTPVVAFLAGGTESIALEEYTEFVEYGNVLMLKEAIYRWVDEKKTISHKLADAAGKRYAKERMGKEYLQLYKEMLDMENRRKGI
jgi:Glycosyltransferase